MKRMYTLLAAALLAALPLAAVQATPDPAGAKKETKEYRLTGFNAIKVSSIYSVDLSRSGKYSVTVEAPDYIMPFLEVHVSDNTLCLEMKDMPRDIRLRMETSRAKEVRATVTMPTLTGLEMSGAATLNAGDAIFPGGKEFELKMSGATHLKGLNVEARQAEIRCSGASNIDLKGSFTKVEAELSGAVKGSLDTGIKPGTVGEIELEMSGAAKLTLNAQVRRMDIEANGAVNLEWKGSADDLKLSASGAAKINAANTPAGQAKVSLSGAAHAMINVEKEMEIRLSGAAACHYKAGPNFRITGQSISRGASLTQL